MRHHHELGTKVDLLYREIAGADKSAYDFLCSFDDYFEDVSRFIDTQNQNRDEFVALLARTNTVYSLPYYVRHGHFLHLVIQQTFNALAAGGGAHGLLVVLAVAQLKLGFVNARKVSRTMAELAAAVRV